MRKLLPLLLLAVLPVPFLVSEDGFPFTITESVLNPVRPAVVAQGGSYTAIAHGYDALFTNPAGFSRPGGSFTLLAPSMWIYGRPQWIPSELDLFVRKGSSTIPDIVRRNTEDYEDEYGNALKGGGFGIGASAGLGYVGHNVGFGLTVTSDSFLSGTPFPAGSEGYIRANVTLTGGFSLPFTLLGIHFDMGLDARYFVQSLSELDGDGMLRLLDSADDFNVVLEQLDSWNGYGFAFDGGVIAAKGPFSFGLSVRDLLNTRVGYAENPLNEVLDTLLRSGNLPQGSIETVSTPMSISLGIGFHPDLGTIRYFFDPSVHAELSDVTGAINSRVSPLYRLHAGASVRLLSMFELMGGFSQGYLTMGAGFQLFCFDVTAAVFTRELGANAGDWAGSGAVVEAAIRF